jgi:endonuclease YncB( thermonuclease family)
MRFWMSAALAGVLWGTLLVAPGPAAAQSVIDGDTIEYKGMVLRLWGIDAPEKAQTCADGWAAGKAAADYLAQLIQGKTVTCEVKTVPGNDKVHYGLCKANGQDLSAAMASAGLAWSLPELTADYTVQDSNAQYMLRGTNAHPCNKAWDWRNEQLKKTGK